MFEGNSYRFQSQAAYKFLKKYIGTQELWTVRYSPNYIFPYEEFQNDNVALGDQVELIVNEEEREEEKRRIRDLEEKIHELTEILNKVQSGEAAKDEQIKELQVAIQNLKLELEREKNKNKEQATSSKGEDRGTIAEIEIPPKK
jgi:hypothetical protein